MQSDPEQLVTIGPVQQSSDQHPVVKSSIVFQQ
jgi:hypothetical protein